MGKRNRSQLRRDRALTARLHCEGWTQEEIAEEITRRARASGEDYSITRPVIAQDLLVIRKQWQKDQTAAIEARVAIEIQKLARLEQVAWKAFRESQKRKRTRMIKKKDGNGKGMQIERRRKIEQRDGNHRFMEVIFKCIDRRLSLLEPRYLPEGTEGESTEKIRRQLALIDASIEGPPADIKNVEIQVLDPKEDGGNGRERTIDGQGSEDQEA